MQWAQRMLQLPESQKKIELVGGMPLALINLSEQLFHHWLLSSQRAAAQEAFKEPGR